MSSPAVTFVPDPKADLLLKSSDGVTFPIRRVFLQASSDVFEDMLSAGADDKTERDKKTGLPIIKLEDKASELDIFLRFIDKDQSRRNLAGDSLSLEETKTLIHLADKYGAKALIDAVGLSSLGTAVATDPPGMFGFAMTHGFIEMARDALALFQKSYRVNSNRGYQGYAIPISGQMSGDQPHLLTNVPKADLARIPFHVMFALQCTQERVLLHGSMWPEAKMIKLT